MRNVRNTARTEMLLFREFGVFDCSGEATSGGHSQNEGYFGEKGFIYYDVK